MQIIYPSAFRLQRFGGVDTVHHPVKFIYDDGSIHFFARNHPVAKSFKRHNRKQIKGWKVCSKIDKVGGFYHS